ncbi:hypothetical protein GM182_04135 [bacterium 3DAC]|nr:hypothetical protein GM182_04135 [bacterium 3DAC]
MKTFLWGYFGGFNVGDELILSAELKLLGSQNVVVVARGNASYISKVHDVEVITYEQAITEVPFHRHIVGGGGLFQDSTSFYNMLYYLYPILVGSSSVLLGVGIGPLRKRLSWHVLSNIMKGLSLAVVRDRLSYKFLTQYVGYEPVIMAPDMVFTLDVISDSRIYHEEDNIIVIPGPAIGMHWDALSTLTRGYKVTVVEFLPRQDSKWRQLYPSDWKVVSGIDALAVGELWDILESSCCWITGRLHGMILSCLLGKPFYPIVYDAKMRLLMSDYCFISSYNMGYANINITEVGRIKEQATNVYSKVRQYLVGKGWVR